MSLPPIPKTRLLNPWVVGMIVVSFSEFLNPLNFLGNRNIFFSETEKWNSTCLASNQKGQAWLEAWNFQPTPNPLGKKEGLEINHAYVMKLHKNNFLKIPKLQSAESFWVSTTYFGTVIYPKSKETDASALKTVMDLPSVPLYQTVHLYLSLHPL